MKMQNILFLTLCMGQKTEFQGAVREGQFTKCEKDVVFELQVRDERSGHIYIYILSYTHKNICTYTHVVNRNCITLYFEMCLGSNSVCQPLLIWLFFFLHVPCENPYFLSESYLGWLFMRRMQSFFQAGRATLTFIYWYLSCFPQRIGRVGGRTGGAVMKGISYVFWLLGNLRKQWASL